MGLLEETIKERRSIRRFENKIVEDEKVTAILEAVRWAPSWGNSQCWEIVVVKDKDLKEKLSASLSKKNPATLTVQDAPIVFVVCGQSKKAGYYNGQQITRYQDWLMFDLGIATQNLSLMAHNLGLGSVIVGSFDHRSVENLLHIPDGFEAVVLVPTGYPAHASSAPKRRECSEFVHYDRF